MIFLTEFWDFRETNDSKRKLLQCPVCAKMKIM